MHGLRRREVIAAFSSAAVWPLAARGQQRAIPVVGFLSSRSPGESTYVVAAFNRGMRESGFVDGENLAIAFRWAEGHYDRLPALATELVDLRVAVLFAAGGQPSALAAKAATATIPIVFSAINDPVAAGVIAKLSRPGGNVTGIAVFAQDLGAKSVELLKLLVPTTAAIAYLVNPSNPSAERYSKDAQKAARALGIAVPVLNASTAHDLDQAFASLAKLGAGGIVVSGEPFFDSERDRIVALSARYALAAIYTWREYAIAGGLMSYGPSLTDSYRQAGIYAGRILKR